jgi:hypothetical protein
MSIVILVMKEFFLTFEFKLQEYLLMDINNRNFKRSFVISISWVLVVNNETDV